MGFPKLISLAILLSILSAGDDNSYCESWKATVETGAAGPWDLVPKRCEQFVKNYMTGGRHLSDSEFVADDAIAFAKNVTLAGDGKDCWIFDVDDTLLSNLPLYAKHGYGADTTTEEEYYEFVVEASAPALPANLRLYKELQRLNFTIFLLTGRDEFQRKDTVKNLLAVGFSHWKRLILRQKADEGTKAIVYKSKRRMELVAEGYTIHGSCGDQWSDLLGNATAVRSFKIPNPMCYLS